jgi:hypothetical protein
MLTEADYKKIAESFQDQIALALEPMRKDFSDLQSSVDRLVKIVETYSPEMVAMAYQLGLQGKWIKRVSLFDLRYEGDGLQQAHNNPEHQR